MKIRPKKIKKKPKIKKKREQLKILSKNSEKINHQNLNKKIFF